MVKFTLISAKTQFMDSVKIFFKRDPNEEKKERKKALITKLNPNNPKLAEQKKQASESNLNTLRRNKN